MKTSTKILLALWIPILTVIIVLFGYCAIGSIKDMNNPDSWKEISYPSILAKIILPIHRAF